MKDGIYVITGFEIVANPIELFDNIIDDETRCQSNMTRLKVFSIFLLGALLFSCRRAMVIQNTPTESGTIGSIDIPSPDFFWLLQPWKEGTLVTMDEQARFAELSFIGESGIRITPLVNFPKERIDRSLIAIPEADICITQSGGMFHIANIATGKTKTFMSIADWRFTEGMPMILDPINGIVLFGHSSYREDDNLQFYYTIYDVKNDAVLHKSPQIGESITLSYTLTPELVLSENWFDNDTRETVFYNWKTQEIFRNKLTEKITKLNLLLDQGPSNILEERYLFADLPMPEDILTYKKVKVTWDENYEQIKIIPLDYLIPEGKWLDEFYFSADGKWATNFVGGYKGNYRELLDKRVFFHFDSRYPNGISMPIFTDGYYSNPWRWGAFVEHPVYGLCYAEEQYRMVGEDEEEKLYLRLYKMDDVLAEINKLPLSMSE